MRRQTFIKHFSGLSKSILEQQYILATLGAKSFCYLCYLSSHILYMFRWMGLLTVMISVVGCFPQGLGFHPLGKPMIQCSLSFSVAYRHNLHKATAPSLSLSSLSSSYRCPLFLTCKWLAVLRHKAFQVESSPSVGLPGSPSLHVSSRV